MRNIEVGRTGYYQDRCAREITDGVHIEPSAPIEPMWKSIVAGIGLIGFMALVIVLF